MAGALVSSGGKHAGWVGQGLGPGSFQAPPVSMFAQDGASMRPGQGRQQPVVIQASQQQQPQGVVSPLMKAIGGQSNFSPITQGKIWDQQQEDQQVNALRSGATARTESDVKRMQEGMTNRGFGSNSPAAQEMAMNARGRNLAGVTGGERDLRFNISDKNEQMLTQREGLRMQQQQAAGAQDIARRQTQTVGYGLTPGTYQPRNQSPLARAMYEQRPQERQLSQNLGFGLG